MRARTHGCGNFSGVKEKRGVGARKFGGGPHPKIIHIVLIGVIILDKFTLYMRIQTNVYKLDLGFIIGTYSIDTRRPCK